MHAFGGLTLGDICLHKVTVIFSVVMLAHSGDSKISPLVSITLNVWESYPCPFCLPHALPVPFHRVPSLLPFFANAPFPWTPPFFH